MAGAGHGKLLCIHRGWVSRPGRVRCPQHERPRDPGDQQQHGMRNWHVCMCGCMGVWVCACANVCLRGCLRPCAPLFVAGAIVWHVYHMDSAHDSSLARVCPLACAGGSDDATPAGRGCVQRWSSGPAPYRLLCYPLCEPHSGGASQPLQHLGVPAIHVKVLQRRDAVCSNVTC